MKQSKTLPANQCEKLVEVRAQIGGMDQCIQQLRFARDEKLKVFVGMLGLADVPSDKLLNINIAASTVEWDDGTG